MDKDCNLSSIYASAASFRYFNRNLDNFFMLFSLFTLGASWAAKICGILLLPSVWIYII